MKHPKLWAARGALGLCLVLLGSGCANFRGPLGMSWSTPPAAPPPAAAAQPTTGTITPPAPPTIEVITRQAADQEQKALVLRAQQLESVIAEKDRAIAQAGQELKAASAELTRSQEELRRWKQETAALREKLRSAEKENVTTLQSVIALMEQMNAHDKAPEQASKPPRPERPAQER